MKASVVLRRLQTTRPRGRPASRASALHARRPHLAAGDSAAPHAHQSASPAQRRATARPSSTPPLLTPSPPRHTAAPLPTASVRAPPTRPLLSAYDTVLHGFDRGPRAFFAEPLESWLSILADSVPLTADCLIICPAHMSPTRVSALLARARRHFPLAHIAPLTPLCHTHTMRQDDSLSNATGHAAHTAHASSSSSCSFSSPSSCATSAQTAVKQSPRLTFSSSHSLHDTVAAPTAEYESATAACPVVSSPPLDSSLAQLPAASLDVMVFAGNVFAQEMLFDAPFYLSAAHRALRPHGVLAILGYDARVEVTSPHAAAEDARAFLQSLHEEVDARSRPLHAPSSYFSTSSSSASVVPPLPPPPPAAARAAVNEESSVRRRTCVSASVSPLTRARDMLESMSMGHADVYLPFRGVRRRWYTSSYAMTPAQLSSCYRALPTYSILRRALPMRYDDWRREQQRQTGAAAEVSSSSACNAVDGEVTHIRRRADEYRTREEREGKGEASQDDFVSLQETRDGLNRTARAEEQAAAAAVMGEGEVEEGMAIRRACAVDSLEVLQHCLDVSLMTECGKGGQGAGRSPTTLGADVRHFVLTCSNRSMNVTDTYRGLNYALAPFTSSPR